MNSSALYQLECKSTQSLDRWIWTDHEQLRHIKTGACLSRGINSNAELQVCDAHVNVQKWYCHEDKLVSKHDHSVLYLRSDQTVALTTIESSTENDTRVKINSNKKSLCSEKGILFTHIYFFNAELLILTSNFGDLQENKNAYRQFPPVGGMQKNGGTSQTLEYIITWKPTFFRTKNSSTKDLPFHKFHTSLISIFLQSSNFQCL